jgi:uncharacterized protein (TIGR00288 family)
VINGERSLAIFIDFENLALGLRDRAERFDIARVLERLVEKGKIVAKKAYADWSRFANDTCALHEAAIELVEIPRRGQTGKNSADIRLCVDAMDLAYSKEHINTFVVLSGDSDFSPLVSKLKELGKHVIGLGMQKSTSELLRDNCDEFIYYEDLGQDFTLDSDLDAHLPEGKRKAFALLIESLLALRRENKEVLWSSMIKDTMKRKKPSFNETYHGYRTFSELLEDAQKEGLIELETDKRSRTYVVTRFGSEMHGPPDHAAQPAPAAPPLPPPAPRPRPHVPNGAANGGPAEAAAAPSGLPKKKSRRRRSGSKRRVLDVAVPDASPPAEAPPEGAEEPVAPPELPEPVEEARAPAHAEVEQPAAPPEPAAAPAPPEEPQEEVPVAPEEPAAVEPPAPEAAPVEEAPAEVPPAEVAAAEEPAPARGRKRTTAKTAGQTSTRTRKAAAKPKEPAKPKTAKAGTSARGGTRTGTRSRSKAAQPADSAEPAEPAPKKAARSPARTEESHGFAAGLGLDKDLPAPPA